VTQRKPEGAHTGGRRKSENRQRQNFVGVRFNRDEYGLLELTAARTGKPMARLLRDAFLASIKPRVAAGTGHLANCEACWHLWTYHGPDGCGGKVFPSHSLTGERCPCKHTPSATQPAGTETNR
jgi:hypothetical protein